MPEVVAMVCKGGDGGDDDDDGVQLTLLVSRLQGKFGAYNPFRQVLHANSPNQPAHATRLQFNGVSVRPLAASSGSIVAGKTSMLAATGEH